MTQRLFLALGLLVAGVLAFASGVYAVAGDDLAIAILTFAVSAAVASLGVYLIGAGISILAHETKLTDWLKRWSE